MSEPRPIIIITGEGPPPPPPEGSAPAGTPLAAEAYEVTPEKAERIKEICVE